MTEAALSELLELVLALGEGQTLPQGGRSLSLGFRV